MSDRFHTILMDPPWWTPGGGKSKRGSDRHYSLIKTVDLPATIEFCPHWDDIAYDAHFYMWVVNSKLPDGLWLMEELGIRYISNLVWTKTRFGLGRYFRGQHEILLFGVRGRGIDLIQSNSNSTWIGIDAIAATKHSKKPLKTYSLIESASPGPYLELFARSQRDGWTVWGNEV